MGAIACWLFKTCKSGNVFFCSCSVPIFWLSASFQAFPWRVREVPVWHLAPQPGVARGPYFSCRPHLSPQLSAGPAAWRGRHTWTGTYTHTNMLQRWHLQIHLPAQRQVWHTAVTSTSTCAKGLISIGSEHRIWEDSWSPLCRNTSYWLSCKGKDVVVHSFNPPGVDIHFEFSVLSISHQNRRSHLTI